MNHQLPTLAVTNNMIAMTMKFVTEHLSLSKPIFGSIQTPINVEMFRRAQAEAKKSSSSHEEEPTVIRNIVVDGNNRIIGAIDTNNKMRRLWPATSAFMPRREEIANDVFTERLLATEFMVKTVKDFVVILFRKMKVDDVFSPKVIREKLDFDNLSHILAHFDMDEDMSIEKTIVLALQNAAYAHAAEKNFNEGDVRNLANDLNPDILRISDLIFIDDKVQFDAAVNIIHTAMKSLGSELSQDEKDEMMNAGLSNAVDSTIGKIVSKAVKESSDGAIRDALLAALERSTAKK